MSGLDSSVKKLYGVGAVRAARYEAMGILSVRDMLSHYPRGYEDRGTVKLLEESDGITKSAYILTVATQPKSARIRGRMTLTKFRAYDDSGVCEITFFNQDYLKNVFVLGSAFRFYGKVEKKSGKYVMMSPAYEPWRDDVELPSLVPIYPLTEGISQKQISKDIRSALALAACDAENEDIIPEDIRKKHKLCLQSYAIKNIHSPDNFAALAAAKRRLIFDEFFLFALGITMAGARRKRSSAYPCTDADIAPLERILPYSLTNAQQNVIDNIRTDMAKDSAMSRMVIGDVGSGKTVCAAAAMLFAVQARYVCIDLL